MCGSNLSVDGAICRKTIAINRLACGLNIPLKLIYVLYIFIIISNKKLNILTRFYKL